MSRTEGGLLCVGLLGPVMVDLDGRRLGPRDFGGRKPKQVLEVLLVHQGQPVPKDRIADLIWSESLPQDPMRTLEAYVSTVRTRLHRDTDRAREVLRSEPGAYRLVLDDAEVDLWRFDDLVAQAGSAPAPEQRLRLRREALDLVRGEVLADEPYADWVRSLRDLYAERHMQLLLDAAEDTLTAARPDLASAYAEQVLTAQPARERAHRLVIAARYMAGDQDRALAAYDRCRRALADELGVSPLEDTERLYLAVLNHDPVDVVVPRSRPELAPAVTSSRPRTSYARSGDGMVAYQITGDGALDVILAPGWFSHVEVGWEEARYTRFVRRLATGRRVVVYDRRGVGMSDPAPPDMTVDQQADDVAAVMDAVGIERAVILGVSGGGPIGVSLAARAPERVAGLVLYSCFGRLMATPDYPWGWSPEFLALYQASLEQAWTEGRGVELALPTARDDPALVEWTSRYLRLSASPATARAMLDFASHVDIRHHLRRVQAPTLVLHRTDEQWIHPDNGRYVADHIPGARFVELPGADYWPWIGDAESVLHRPGDVAAALQPTKGGIDILHHGDDLTIGHVVWAPGMRIYPHNHHMWAAIGIYTGREDNTFYRRSGPQRHDLTESGGKSLTVGEVLVLGDDAIHGVASAERGLTGAIHVYGGDFVNEPRSQWGPGPLEERPYDLDEARHQFAQANQRWLGTAAG